MLDLKFIRENTETVKKGLNAKNARIDLNALLELDKERRRISTQLDGLKGQKNAANDEIGRLLKEKKDPKSKIAAMKGIAAQIDTLEPQAKEIEGKIEAVLMNIPNIPHSSVPIGRAATALLERAGFNVVLPAPQVCCGRPLISKGFLAQAKERAKANVAALAPYVERGWPIVGIEPSCMLSFRDDYLDLVADPRAQQVADNVFMLEEFLAGLASEKDLGIEFSPVQRQVLVHGHCQQKALVGTGATLEVLRLAPGFEVSEIQSGCCGMAGSFGYEKEHYEISMKVGEDRLFKVIREAGPEVEIAAVGTSCRHQIAEATGHRVRHWAEILAEAL